MFIKLTLFQETSSALKNSWLRAYVNSNCNTDITAILVNRFSAFNLVFRTDAFATFSKSECTTYYIYTELFILKGLYSKCKYKSIS